jgi:hypothetical protein
MFPLAGKDFPTSSDALVTAIGDALADVFTFPQKQKSVSISGGKFPDLKTVSINLDGAEVSVDKPPPKPVGIGSRKPGVTVEKLTVSGHPIRYGRARLDLDITAKSLRFDFDRDQADHPLLVLAAAHEGNVAAKIDRADIQSLLLEAATALAGQQGVTIQDLQLKLTSEGPRDIAANVRVKAKKMMMSGVIQITGRLTIDDEFNARVSGLKCVGEGFVGGAAATFLQKKLAPIDGTKIPLMAFSLGDVTLRDVKISLVDSLQVNAAFGNN